MFLRLLRKFCAGSINAWQIFRSALFLLQHSDFFVQIRALDFQRLRGFGDVAIVRFQALQNVMLFKEISGVFQRFPGRRDERRAAV